MKQAIIIGASSGIGEALTRKLARVSQGSWEKRPENT